MLSLATLANILSYSDTLLLADSVTIETLGTAMPVLIETLRASVQKPQRLYAAAAIANASFHPRLVQVLNKIGGERTFNTSPDSEQFVFSQILNIMNYFLFDTALQLCRDVERQSMANLHIIGSKLSECAQTAVYRLSEKKEGDPKLGGVKYR